LAAVLEHLATREPPDGVPVEDVPRGKLEANDLSASVRDLLQAGMRKAPMVKRFFETWHDPTYGVRMATAFRMRYQELRTQTTPSMHANAVFHELLSWAGGGNRQAPERDVAVLAIMAYFFEQCEIFEAPRGTGS
jgi:hypothetical protein